MGSKEEAVHDFATEPGLVSGIFWALSRVRSPLDMVFAAFCLQGSDWESCAKKSCLSHGIYNDRANPYIPRKIWNLTSYLSKLAYISRLHIIH